MTVPMTGVIEMGSRVVIRVGSRWKIVTPRDYRAWPRLPLAA
jgi:hypothetical protein